MRIPIIPDSDSANTTPTDRDAVNFEIGEETVVIEMTIYDGEKFNHIVRRVSFNKAQLLYVLNTPVEKR